MLGAPCLDSETWETWILNSPRIGDRRNPRSENPDLGHPSSVIDRDVGHRPRFVSRFRLVFAYAVLMFGSIPVSVHRVLASTLRRVEVLPPVRGVGPYGWSGDEAGTRG
jgi:hypothetical protein